MLWVKCVVIPCSMMMAFKRKLTTFSSHLHVSGCRIGTFVEYQWCWRQMNVTWLFKFRSHLKKIGYVSNIQVAWATFEKHPTCVQTVMKRTDTGDIKAKTKNWNCVTSIVNTAYMWGLSNLLGQSVQRELDSCWVFCWGRGKLNS